MNRVFRAKGVLVADGVGCAIAGSAVLGSDLVASAIDPSLKSRPIIGAALGATSVTLFAATVRSRDSDLSLAAAVNLGWVGVCLIALSRRPSRLGVALIAATAAFDSVAATAQWRLRAATDALERSDRSWNQTI